VRVSEDRNAPASLCGHTGSAQSREARSQTILTYHVFVSYFHITIDSFVIIRHIFVILLQYRRGVI